MSCPMKSETGLTEKQVKYFCSLGCSIKCGEFLKDYKKRIKKSEKSES